MFGGLNRLVAVALVVGGVLVGPSVALACSGGPSAVNVYSECLQTGGGGKPTSSKPTTSGPLSAKTRYALNRAGKDKHRLLQVLRDYGHSARIAKEPDSASTAATSPSALGSAFDLGSGPTALLAVLAATALVLLGTTGFRGYRRWHRS